MRGHSLRRRAAAAAAAVAAAALWPLPASAESLADALVDAWLLSPELAAQRAEVKIQSERAVQAAASINPAARYP